MTTLVEVILLLICMGTVTLTLTTVGNQEPPVNSRPGLVKQFELLEGACVEDESSISLLKGNQLGFYNKDINKTRILKSVAERGLFAI